MFYLYYKIDFQVTPSWTYMSPPFFPSVKKIPKIWLSEYLFNFSEYISHYFMHFITSLRTFLPSHLFIQPQKIKFTGKYPVYVTSGIRLRPMADQTRIWQLPKRATERNQKFTQQNWSFIVITISESCYYTYIGVILSSTSTLIFELKPSCKIWAWAQLEKFSISSSSARYSSKTIPRASGTC